jgi:hypothetical protein
LGSTVDDGMRFRWCQPSKQTLDATKHGHVGGGGAWQSRMAAQTCHASNNGRAIAGWQGGQQLRNLGSFAEVAPGQ